MALSPTSCAPSTLGRLADLLDPPKVEPSEVYERLGFTPNPGRQTDFLDATEFDVGYGGAAGGGKTIALLVLGISACIRWPGIQVWAFRRSYPELRDSLIRELHGMGDARALGATWRESTKELSFANGSVLKFRYCENYPDATRYQGAEMQLLLIDERTLMLPEVVDFLASRLRSSDPRIPVLGVRSGTNPGGVGHGAFKRRYVTPTDYGKHTYCDNRGRLVRFIPAKITDNPKLNPEYEADLDAIADESLRAALKDGNWDTFAGQYFSEWRHDRHVVPAFEIPATWKRLAGIDWGYAAPHAVIWCAVDQDARVWVHRERYGTQTGEREVARQILEAEGALADDERRAHRPAEKVLHLADPSMWSKVGDANPIADTFAAEGVPLLRASNDRVAGWQRIHTYLADAPACFIHREAGLATCPKLHVLDGAAPNLVRTLPELVHDKTHVEDVDTDGEDHAPDALRYALMRLALPRRDTEPAPKPTTPQERIAARIAKRRSASLVT